MTRRKSISRCLARGNRLHATKDKRKLHVNGYKKLDKRAALHFGLNRRSERRIDRWEKDGAGRRHSGGECERRRLLINSSKRDSNIFDKLIMTPLS